MELESKKISSRELTKGQRRKVAWIVKWYRERESYNGVTSIRFNLVKFDDSKLAFMTLKTRRSDCGKYSPRAIICERSLHAMLGPRGGTKVISAEWGIGNSEKSHVKKFI